MQNYYCFTTLIPFLGRHSPPCASRQYLKAKQLIPGVQVCYLSLLSSFMFLVSQRQSLARCIFLRCLLPWLNTSMYSWRSLWAVLFLEVGNFLELTQAPVPTTLYPPFVCGLFYSLVAIKSMGYILPGNNFSLEF